MKSDSSKTKQKGDKALNIQEDIEKLQTNDPAFLESLQEEMRRATPFLNKALDSIKKLTLKGIAELKSLLMPSEEVVGVLCALVYLLAENIPDDYLKVDGKKGPVVKWVECKRLLDNRALFFESVMKVGEWINEERITYEMTMPVRGYMEKSWWNEEKLRKKSMAVANNGEFVRNMIACLICLEE